MAENHPLYQAFARAQPLPRLAGETVEWKGLAGCAESLALARLRRELNDFLLVIAPSVARAEAVAGELSYFLGPDPGLAVLPDAEVLPYDAFSPHQDLISRRLAVLRDLLAGRIHTLLVAGSTVLPRLPPCRYIGAYSIALRQGQPLNPEQLRLQLETAGYQRVSQVMEHGDYAIRGSLLDFFPMGAECPVRVDFLDLEIDSMRWFDPDTQLSGAAIPALDTLPAREMPVDGTGIRQFRQAYRRRFEGNPARSLIYREVSEGRLPGGIENYLPLFFEETALLWDYLPARRLTVSLAQPGEILDKAWAMVEERYRDAGEDVERPAMTPAELNGTPAEHAARLATAPLIVLPAGPDGGLLANGLPQPPPGPLLNLRDPEPGRNLLQFLRDFPGRTLIAAESAGRRELLGDLLREAGATAALPAGWAEFLASSAPLALTVAPLTRGMTSPDGAIAILTEQELFGERTRPRQRQRRARDPAQIIRDLTDLREGAPIVHLDHGVGRYRGLTTISIDAIPTEFLTVEYAGGDLLHVPVASLHLISRYTGTSPEEAPLHRLGTDQWDRARRRAAERLRDVAAELLELYARRAARRTTRGATPMGDYAAFAAGFPFEPTEDQARAIEDVLEDLRREQPMDRLVCGDVGFGKTEVALRAAFAAVSAGQQVALLVPTTLLAQQHYQTFSDRFADWPYTVEALSRFRSAPAVRRILDGVASGAVDIVIGTHRLLQGDVRFRRLGLIIVDEEHRFGVRHKERLKALRAEADVLTLTATPIPRTLNMALGRLRDLSLIATPPETRLTIKTFVTRWEQRVIREACLRELKRGGQVYFVHNRIEDIQRIAAEVSELVPEARLQIAHGQMPERELEQIMLDFYHRRFHILVCTAIIESGIDVPSANTILINRADRFGLAQLHQLRGRVGRSHHQAFAYLLTPPREALTPDAVKRLDAIASLEDLGSGFLLATHDMEIRGAGELLGEDQSGQIQEIGFELYNEMLARTVRALEQGLEPDPAVTGQAVTEINLHLAALLPADYLEDVHLRLVHYKRIASARTELELRELQAEIVDRFGPLPEATRNLFRLTNLRLRAEPLGIRRIEAGPTGGFVEFGPSPAVSPEWLVDRLRAAPRLWRLDRQQRLRFTTDLALPDERFSFVEGLVGDMLSSRGRHAPASPLRPGRAGTAG